MICHCEKNVRRMIEEEEKNRVTLKLGLKHLKKNIIVITHKVKFYEIDWWVKLNYKPCGVECSLYLQNYILMMTCDLCVYTIKNWQWQKSLGQMQLLTKMLPEP